MLTADRHLLNCWISDCNKNILSFWHLEDCRDCKVTQWQWHRPRDLDLDTLWCTKKGDFSSSWWWRQTHQGPEVFAFFRSLSSWHSFWVADAQQAATTWCRCRFFCRITCQWQSCYYSSSQESTRKTYPEIPALPDLLERPRWPSCPLVLVVAEIYNG